MNGVMTSPLDAHVKDHGNCRFLWCEGDGRLFPEMQERADRVATGADRIGPQHGEPVALPNPKRTETVELICAIATYPLNANEVLKLGLAGNPNPKG